MKTTKKDFELFKKECEKWIDFFGLKDWEFYYEHYDTDSRAQYEADISGKVASIRLGLDWKDCDINDELIKKAAFHEICHVILSEIHLCLSRSVSENIEERLLHSVIRRLENSIFKELEKPKKKR